MKRKLRCCFPVLIFLALMVFHASRGFGYGVCQTGEGLDIRWDTAAATYYINDAGGPAGSIDAIIAGMQTWTDVATSDFIFSYGGTTSSSAHQTNDALNIVTFGSLPVGTAAENYIWYNPPTGYIIDTDVRFNTYYSWSTTGGGGAFDVQNVGTHEHGHSLCLEDLYGGADSEKTMYGNVASGETKKRTLHQDDIDGITDLYPCPYDPVRIENRPFEYVSLQAAYDSAKNGDTIIAQATTFTENLFLDLNKSVGFEGGYGCDFSPVPIDTVLDGNVDLSDGDVWMEHFRLE